MLSTRTIYRARRKLACIELAMTILVMAGIVSDGPAVALAARSGTVHISRSVGFALPRSNPQTPMSSVSLGHAIGPSRGILLGHTGASDCLRSSSR